MAEGILQGKTGVILGVANERSIAWACAPLTSVGCGLPASDRPDTRPRAW